jgi:predicted aspartyl protease
MYGGPLAGRCAAAGNGDDARRRHADPGGGHDGTYNADFLVDIGATDSRAPTTELRRIGVQPVGSTRYELADGTVHEFPVGLVRIELMGEVTAGRVIFGPDGAEPIVGVTTLEALGITVDPATGTLKRLPAIPLKSLCQEPGLGAPTKAFRRRCRSHRSTSGRSSSTIQRCTMSSPTFSSTG